ncbi:hypothetical protein H2203_005659 [Taxawa tesnikishii (nom. ined.)]|nr:hypothetical protein H2203_005659 [Dothideales sp. JES 119]
MTALRGHVPSAVALVKNGRTMLQQIRSRDQNRNKPASSTTSSVPDQTLNTVFNRLEPQDNCGNDDTATKGESKTRLQHENNNQNRNASAAASREPYVSTQELETLFTRLELQVVEIRKDLDALPVPIAPSFTSLAQVRDSLEYYWHDYMASTAFEYTSEAEIARLQRYAAIFKQWSSNFDSFVKLRGSTLSESERRGVAALRMQRNSLWASLNIQKPGEDDQMLWDAYLPLFKENVSLAATAVGVSLDELDDLSTPSPPKAPCFSLDIGIVGPLFALARKCRHPLIRRQAIKLLRAAPRQEGFWDGMMAARVAERVVELEEEGLTDVKECADVPDACRISEIWPVFDYESRQATVRYARPNRASGVPGRDLTETFVW